MLRGTVWILLASAVTALAAAAAAGIRWNASPSVAPGLYLEREGALQRGDLVIVCLPAAVGRWARGRGYLERGDCEGEAAELGKWVAAVEGDVIEVSEETITVNGFPVSGARRADRDAEGRPVPLFRAGELILGPGEVWLHSDRHLRSLDSRVFGPLKVEQIRGALEPLWVARD